MSRDFKNELLELLRSDEEFRYAVAGLLGLDTILSELKMLREDFNRAFKALDRRLMALGARWGIESEIAFREAMKGVIEEILGAGEVGKWVYFDEEGEVFGYPTQVEADVLIKDGVHVLIGVKSSASDGDVSKLWRIGNLYAKVVGVKPRLALIAPFIDERGLETAKKLGVEVYTRT